MLTPHRRRMPRPARRRSESGVTLIEILIAIVVVGTIAGVLSQAFVGGLRTTTSVSHRVAKTDDVQRISTSWTRDVQSVDVDGVNPAGVTCGTGGTGVITFLWSADSGSSVPNPSTVVTWAATGSGTARTLVRRVCDGSNLATPTATHFVAGDFMDQNTVVASAITGTCTTTACTITLNGVYRYSLKVNRRSRPVGTNPPATSGANLFAISNVPGTTQVWTVGLNCGLFFYGGSGSATRVSLATGLCSGKALYGIVAVGSSVWAVGEGGLILRCASSCTTATNWATVASPTTNTLYAVTADNIAGTGSNTGRTKLGLVAVGASGTIVTCRNADCSSAAATWTQVSTATNPDLVGQTFTSVAATSTANAGPTSSSEATIVFVTARGTAPTDASKGRLIKCQGKCFSTAASWAYATSSVQANSGQLSVVGSVPNAGSGFPAFILTAGDAGRVLTCFNCSNFTLLGPVQPQVLVATAATDGSSGNTSSFYGTLVVGSDGEIASCEGTINACTGTMTMRTAFVGFQIFGATRTSQTSNSSTNATAYLVGAGGLVKVTNLNNSFQASCTATTTPITCETIPLP